MKSYNRKSIRVVDRRSIWDYVEKHKNILIGRVLDFGCGNMPYRDLVSGNYYGFDPKNNNSYPQDKFDAILCTQVIQEVDSPQKFMQEIYNLLKKKGFLILTYNTHWEEYGYPDRWRLTQVGMEDLCKKTGFTIVDSTRRYGIDFEDFTLGVGYGIVCKK